MTKAIENVDEYIQNMSVEELNEWCKDATPIELNYSKEEIEQSKKIYEIMDLTDLDFEDVEKVLYEPRNAPLYAIEIYCKRLNINTLEFIQKVLA